MSKHRLLPAVVLVLGAVSLGACPPPSLWTRLHEQQHLVPLPPAFEVLYVAYRTGKGPGQTGTVVLRRNPGGRLPPAQLVDPPGTLSAPGFYVGVTLPGTPPQFAYLVHLGDPRYVVGETVKGDDYHGVIVQQPAGTLITRVPFLANGTLVIYEILPSLARKLHFERSLGSGAFPAVGVDFPVASP